MSLGGRGCTARSDRMVSFAKEEMVNPIPIYGMRYLFTGAVAVSYVSNWDPMTEIE
jgi:hypothetical protein